MTPGEAHEQQQKALRRMAAAQRAQFHLMVSLPITMFVLALLTCAIGIDWATR